MISYEKKNPTKTFIQLLRTKTIKNKIKNKYSERNLTLMQLQLKLGREKKNKFIKYTN